MIEQDLRGFEPPVPVCHGQEDGAGTQGKGRRILVGIRVRVDLGSAASGDGNRHRSLGDGVDGAEMLVLAPA
jgi:hypothetical protein